MAHLLDTFNTQLLTTWPGSRRQQQQQHWLGIASGLPQGLLMPASGSKQDWLAYVAALPDADAPHVLGLPASIERSMALGHSKRLLAALRQINAGQVRTRGQHGRIVSHQTLVLVARSVACSQHQQQRRAAADRISCLTC